MIKPEMPMKARMMESRNQEEVKDNEWMDEDKLLEDVTVQDVDTMSGNKAKDLLKQAITLLNSEQE